MTMPTCPLCKAFVDGGSSYCANCGRPRITEGLRIPVVQPDWQKRVVQALIVVAAFWLLITTGVAFLREAKAVRVGRKLLALDNPQGAWSLLNPFLANHPQHLQGLFLCGKATIRLDLRKEAKQCLTAVSQQSPELAEELGKDYRQILTKNIRGQKTCDESSASRFAETLGWAEELGEPYAASVFAGLDGVVEACQQDYYGLSRFITVLAQRDQTGKMLERGYVPAIRKAIGRAGYGDAYRLVQQAVQLFPQDEAKVKEVLDEERRKVSATVGSLRQLCDNLKTDAQYRTGDSWCFPATAPTAMEVARDGWGRRLSYSPLGPDDAQRCHQGFAITSFGGDGTVTQNDGTPAAEMVCSFVHGRESWQLPQRYWMIPNDR